MLRAMELVLYEERLEELDLFRLQNRSLWEDFTAGFMCLVVTERTARLFSAMHTKRWGAMDRNCFEGKADWILGRKSSTTRVVKSSNRWPREAANHPAWSFSKLSWISLEQPDLRLKSALLWAGGWARDSQRSLPTRIILLFCNWKHTWLEALLDSTQTKKKLS